MSEAQARREKFRKAKAEIEIQLARDIRPEQHQNKKIFDSARSKTNTEECIGPSVNGRGSFVMDDEVKEWHVYCLFFYFSLHEKSQLYLSSDN